MIRKYNVESTLIGTPPKNKKLKRVPPCNINFKNLAHYLETPGIYTCTY